MTAFHRGLAGLCAVVLIGIASSCATPGAVPAPDFKLVSAHWLLCPVQAGDLTMCCPQPADPRRCVVPNAGAAPLALAAFGRFQNVGAAGSATATFTTTDAGRAKCSAVLPVTPSGGTTNAWCSLGPGVESAFGPQVSVDNTRP